MTDDEWEWYEDDDGEWYFRHITESHWTKYEENTDYSNYENKFAPEEKISNPTTVGDGLTWDECLFSPSNKYLLKKFDSLVITDKDDVIDEILSNCSTHSSNRLHVSPNIPSSKLNYVINKKHFRLNKHISINDIWLLFDESFFRNGIKGFIVTNRGLFFHEPLFGIFPGPASSIPWRLGASRITGFEFEKKFANSYLYAIIDHHERKTVWTNSQTVRTLDKIMDILVPILNQLAEYANIVYCNKLGISPDFDFSNVESDGDCPKCGGILQPISLKKRGLKALTRGFAKVDRHLVGKMNSQSSLKRQSIFGRKGGIRDHLLSDVSLVCKECGYKE